MHPSEIRCRWSRTVEPTIEPVTLAEAKDHARISDDNSNSVIEGYITVARQACEDYTGRGLLTQTWTLVLDYFANVIPLPSAAPLQSVSSITYYDGDGTQQTLATSVYDTDTVARPAAVVLKPGQAWPSLQSDRRNGRVTITYVVGWTTPASVPDRFKQGIKQYVTYLDADRDGLEPQALAAKAAAERHWADQVFWTPPQWCEDY